MSTNPASTDAGASHPHPGAERVAASAESAIALLDRGRELRLEGRLSEAVECFENALRLDPACARAHAGYAATLGRLGRHTQAIASYWEALRLDPGNPRIWAALGNRYLEQGRAELAVDCYRQALSFDPNDELTRAVLLFALHCDPRRAPEEIFRAHCEYGARHGLPPRLPPAPLATGGRLRIGYLSGDFYTHPVSSFFEPILAHHSRADFDIFLYSNTAQEDEVTARLRHLAGDWPWRDITGLSDDEAAQTVRADAIDILVDLSGHTMGSRLAVLARKPAPVQATYLGYPNTTGIPAIDFRFTDAVADPPGLADRLHTERLVRLPRGFLCFARPQGAPEVGPPPFVRAGAIAFGSCSKALKWNSEVVRVWAAILRRTPGSRLLLHHSTSDRDGTRTNLLEQFFTHGVSPDRIEILGGVDWRRHWEWFHRVDLALDPFPYNGTMGTCEALWMGVPVIALEGRTHVSRVGVSLLTGLHLEHLLAATPEEYIEKTVRLAAAPAELAHLRAGMRERMARAPLMDGAGFTRHLEEAYRWMWGRALARDCGAGIYAAASAP